MSAFSPSMSGDARIALAPGVSIAGSAVQDEAAGQRYPLTGVAREILERLEGGEAVADVAAALSESYGVPLKTVTGDMNAFLDHMDRQGLISARQSYRANIAAFLRSFGAAASSPANLLVIDTSTLAQPTRRHPAKLIFVILACMEALIIPCAAGLGLIAAFVAFKGVAAWQQGVSVPDTVVFAAVRPTLAIGIFTLLFICHEAGHLVAIRALGMTPRSVATRMWSVGITYVPATPGKMLAVAVAGPLAAAVVALGLAALISIRPMPELGIGPFEVSYIVLFGLLHLWSLRPWAQDGRQAANALVSLGRSRRASALDQR
jgi:hypothetical protein